MVEKNFDENVSLIKIWIKEGLFGRKSQHWCEIILGIFLSRGARFENEIYVPFPKLSIESVSFKTGRTSFPLNLHGGFYNPCSKRIGRKFALEVLIEKDFKGELVAKDISGLVTRYLGSEVILGIHSEKRISELSKIFTERPDLMIRVVDLYPYFTFSSEEEFKSFLKDRWDEIETECGPHQEGIDKCLKYFCHEYKFSQNFGNNQCIVSGATNKIIISNRDFEYREGYMRNKKK